MRFSADSFAVTRDHEPSFGGASVQDSDDRRHLGDEHDQAYGKGDAGERRANRSGPRISFARGDPREDEADQREERRGSAAETDQDQIEQRRKVPGQLLALIAGVEEGDEHEPAQATERGEGDRRAPGGRS